VKSCASELATAPRRRQQHGASARDRRRTARGEDKHRTAHVEAIACGNDRFAAVKAALANASSTT
jgi:hypothetical protein